MKKSVLTKKVSPSEASFLADGLTPETTEAITKCLLWEGVYLVEPTPSILKGLCKNDCINQVSPSLVRINERKDKGERKAGI